MLFSLLTTAALAAAHPGPPDMKPYSGALAARQDSNASSSSSSPQVDLGYSVYEGAANASTNLDVFQGIRFGQAPVGELRFQAPRAPEMNRSSTIEAKSFGAQCPQSPRASPGGVVETDNSENSEDCLFLNVYAPNNVTGPLPVLVYIHGGGYGEGNAQADFTDIINTNENAFVVVTIQYRLGAFGFLSSDEVHRKGAVNAALLDQLLGLQWVQQYVHLFGGDSSQVTIAGESAGAGSVMLMDMAYGGSIGSRLFQNSIGSSPYLPMQYGYADWVPSQAYYAFASAAGCMTQYPYGNNGTMPIFECLQSADYDTLANASATVSQQGAFGTWAFLPVTDGMVVQDLPSCQLNRGNLNGVNGLFGNNANEGQIFVPQDINTRDELESYIRRTFPLLSDNDVSKLFLYYPPPAKPDNETVNLFATDGTSSPSQLNSSAVATGHQQLANLIYGETTFICPSYWLAEAYSQNSRGGQAYKYQFSIPPALHAQDLNALNSPPTSDALPGNFFRAFQRVWGNFVTNSTPALPEDIAGRITSDDESAAALSGFPAYTLAEPLQLDMNTTCPDVTMEEGSPFPMCTGPEGEVRFETVNAWTWEAGRGQRCDFWRSLGDRVPE